jgi:superfamily II DNA or RNA helicase/HKD family nuclease
MPDKKLAPGLYDRLITTELKSRLLEFDPDTTTLRQQPVDEAESHSVLARHVGDAVNRVLRELPARDRLQKQQEITNELLRLLERPDSQVAEPPEVLQSIQLITGIPANDVPVVAPLVALSDSDLLVNARGEPALVHALAHEIPSADSVDLICAFVRWHGLRVLEDQLVAHCRAGKPFRVITTVYTGSTERKALDWLVSLGAQVKVSYDTQSTRLHAKAWMFRRATGYSTAYIGSSNLSKSALIDGVEWNVRLSQIGLPDILEKFDATFENYWQSPEYEPYNPDRDADRFDRAVAADRVDMPDAPLAFLDVEPWPHQREILETLSVERERHHRFKNLVVAATGTGKTIVAALDFKRLRNALADPRLLFVAHRQEILRQSLGAFRNVLRDGDFGELYVGGHRPDEWRHVFASIQSLAQVEIDRLDPSAFDVVIVDEFHHAAAPTYRRVLQRLQPQILLGLTATPERTDAGDILHYFDGHIAAELRLWDALERGLLCPFQYFGLHDNSDLTQVTWSRKGYDVSELENLYTADDARVGLVLQQLQAKHRDARTMRALGFCVSIAHAEFMARKFSDAGLASQAVSADTDSNTRRIALADLRSGRLRALFAVDLFNEGVDLPEVDTLMLLRPTESALVFMQQLGRGLRRFEGKDCVTVLDFIGQAHRKFRFDLRYRAITGGTRSEVEKQIELGFPYLPAGCSMQLDKVASKIVLENLRSAIPSARPAMVRELRALMESDRFRQRAPALAEFLQETGLELGDVYRNGCWSTLKRAAGVSMPTAGPQEDAIGDAFVRLLHIDDPLRLDAYRSWLSGPATAASNEVEARIALGLPATIWGQKMPATVAEARTRLQSHSALVEELNELLDLLEAEATHLTYPLASGIPLSVHARHSLVDVFAAIGRITPGEFYQHREGVYYDEETNTDLFFVTLKKSDREYSKSTLYKDYAISPTLFHWESQSTTTVASRTAQRYIHHRERGGHVLLFVRQQKRLDGQTVPYTLLGPGEYVSHQQERPIQFVWRLQRPMPADFFRQAKVAAG